MTTSRDGGSEDYAAVFDLHHERLLRIAYLLRADLAAAEDDVADAFARTLEPWRAGRVTDVGAYLRAAVVNASRSRWRSQQRHAAWLGRQRSEGTIQPDALVADREALRIALARLPRGQRVAVVLRFVDDLSERATAEAMGVSVGTVKSQTARGLASLRVALEDLER